MIIVRNLSKKYEGETKNTISNVNLMFNNSGLYYIIGPSGSGKTTLVSILGCMDDQYEGDVLYNGISLKTLSKDEQALFRLNYVGFSFQGGFLDNKAKVKDELLKGLDGKNIKNSEKNKLIAYYLNFFEIKKYKNKKIENLSGGEKKRVSLARSMIKNPSILIVDEPTAGLNEKLANKVMRKLKEISSTSLVLVVTHDDINEVDCNIIKINNGNVILEKEIASDTNNRIEQKCNSSIKSKSLIRNAFKILVNNIKKISSAVIALTISLTSFGIAFCLIIGVRNGFTSIGNSAFDKTTILIEPKENLNIKNKNVLGDEDLINDIKEKLPNHIVSTGIEYPINLNDIVDSTSYLYLNINDNYRYPNNFGVDILAHSIWIKSYEDVKIYGEQLSTLEHDEVYLGLSLDTINYLFNSFSRLQTLLINNKIILKGKIIVYGVNGYKEFQLIVKGFYESSNPSIMHTSTLCTYNILENIIGFEGSYNLTSLDPKPNTLKKGAVVYVENNNLGNFYRSFKENESFNKYAIEKYPTNLMIKTGLVSNHTKIFIRPKKYADINSSDLLKIVSKYKNKIKEYSFSNSIYTYVQGGMYAGFTMPVFLSSNRESLIQLSDENSITDMNLGMFQIASANIPDGVLGADLSSSIEGKGIDFLSPLNKKVDKGSFPSNDKAIAISSNLANKIYKTDNVIGNKLCLLLLGEITKYGNSYKNIFYDCDLTVSGIVESDKDCLYHDAYFPEVLAFNYVNKSGVDLYTQNAIIKFDNDDSQNEILKDLKQSFTQYDFSCPFKEMSKSIETIINKISLGLSIFASISLVLSIYLMFLTCYLTIKNDEKGIADINCNK